MDWRLRINGALYRRALDKAGDDASLAALVRSWLTRYVDGTTSQQIAARARAAALTPERRSEIARLAARARHQRDPSPD